MKTLLCSLALAGMALAQTESVIVYRMSRIPREDPRFEKIRAAVEASSKPVPVQTDTFQIVQTVSPGKYLASRELGNSSVISSLELPGTVLTDGEWVKAAVKESGVFSYESVLGARKTVKNHVRVEKEEPRPLTPGELIESLVSGKEYRVELGTTEITCITCAGAGKIPSVKSSNKDKKEPCKICHASGKTKVAKIARILW